MSQNETESLVKTVQLMEKRLHDLMTLVDNINDKFYKNDLKEPTSVDLIFTYFSALFILAIQSGFSLLEIGSVRVTNVSAILIDNVLAIAGSILAYITTGYAISFGDDIGHVFGSTGFFLSGQEKKLGLVFFQWTFAVMVVAIAATAMVGRASHKSCIISSLLMAGLVYPIVAHWAWTKNGWMQNGPDQLRFIDYAGSGVVHVCGGAAALAGSCILGRQKISQKGEACSSPVYVSTLVTLGYFIIMCALLAFTGASVGAVSRERTSETIAKTVINAATACSGGVIVTIIITTAILHFKPGYWLLMCIVNGGLSGIVSICAACQVVPPLSAFIIGSVGAVSTRLWAHSFRRTGLEDACGAIAVHFAAGLWGILAAPVFAEEVGFLYTGSSRSLLIVCWNMACTLTIIAWTVAIFASMYFMLDKCNFLHTKAEAEDHVTAQDESASDTTFCCGLIKFHEKSKEFTELEMLPDSHPETPQLRVLGENGSHGKTSDKVSSSMNSETWDPSASNHEDGEDQVYKYSFPTVLETFPSEISVTDSAFTPPANASRTTAISRDMNEKHQFMLASPKQSHSISVCITEAVVHNTSPTPETKAASAAESSRNVTTATSSDFTDRTPTISLNDTIILLPSHILPSKSSICATVVKEFTAAPPAQRVSLPETGSSQQASSISSTSESVPAQQDSPRPTKNIYCAGSATTSSQSSTSNQTLTKKELPTIIQASEMQELPEQSYRTYRLKTVNVSQSRYNSHYLQPPPVLLAVTRYPTANESPPEKQCVGQNPGVQSPPESITDPGEPVHKRVIPATTQTGSSPSSVTGHTPVIKIHPPWSPKTDNTEVAEIVSPPIADYDVLASSPLPVPDNTDVDQIASPSPPPPISDNTDVAQIASPPPPLPPPVPGNTDVAEMASPPPILDNTDEAQIASLPPPIPGNTDEAQIASLPPIPGNTDEAQMASSPITDNSDAAPSTSTPASHTPEVDRFLPASATTLQSSHSKFHDNVSGRQRQHSGASIHRHESLTEFYDSLSS